MCYVAGVRGAERWIVLLVARANFPPVSSLYG